MPICKVMHVTDNGNDTRVYGVGSNFSGQLGLPYETEEVQEPIEIRWKNMFPDTLHDWFHT
jgi:alpha-tubulin suppressor-like RCC1 family protein